MDKLEYLQKQNRMLFLGNQSLQLQIELLVQEKSEEISSKDMRIRDLESQLLVEKAKRQTERSPTEVRC